MDRWLKRVWLVNGVLILALILFGVGAALSSLSLVHGDDGVAMFDGEAGPDSKVRPGPVRLDEPREIAGTDVRLVRVRRQARTSSGLWFLGSGDVYVDGTNGSSIEWRSGSLVNAIFLSPDGTARLLFEQPAHIGEIDWPQAGRKADSDRRWIAVSAALEDSDGNGHLDADDRQGLYLVDLDGARLRRALPDSVSVTGFDAFGGPDRLLAFAVPAEHRDDAAGRQLAFIVDARTGESRPFAAVDSLVGRAARIVGPAER